MTKALYVLPALVLLGMLPVAHAQQDSQPPALRAVEFNTDTRVLKFTFNETIDASETDITKFRITNGGNSFEIDGTLESTEDSDTVEFSINQGQANAIGNGRGYSIGDDAVKDLNGNPFVATTGGSIPLTSDTTPPSLVSATFDKTTRILEMVFDETIDVSETVLRDIIIEGNFSYAISQISESFDQNAPDSDTLTFTLDGSLDDQERLNLEFFAGAVKDTAGNGITAATTNSVTIIRTEPPGTGRTFAGDVVIAPGNSLGVATTPQSPLHVRIDGQPNGADGVRFEKVRDATNAVRYSFWDVGGLTTDANGGAFWRGYHLAAPGITVDGNQVWPRLAWYAEYDAETNPSHRQWIIESFNSDGAGQKHDILYRISDKDILYLDDAGRVGINLEGRAPTEALEVGGNLRLGGQLHLTDDVLMSGDTCFGACGGGQPPAPACAPPSSGHWDIRDACALASDVSVPAGVTVHAPAVLAIPAGVTLDVDLANHGLLVRSGAGLLIQHGGGMR